MDVEDTPEAQERGPSDEAALAIAHAAASWGAMAAAAQSPVGDPPGMVRIAIGTSPGSGTTLESDVRLAKAALLYGDRVRLYSPAASLLVLVSRIPNLDEDAKLGFILDVAEVLQPQTAAAFRLIVGQFRSLRGKRHRSPEEIKTLGIIRYQLLGTAWAEMSAGIDGVIEGTGVGELRPAVEAGLLEIDPILDGQSYDEDALLRSFLLKLEALLADQAAYPIFDDQTGDLVKAKVAEGLLAPSEGALRRGRQAGTAAGLMYRLPTFPRATIDEILSIRTDLQKPLVAFRAGVCELAGAIAAAQFDRAFDEELQDLYMAKVAPAILEIEEMVRSNVWLRDLIGEAVGDVKTLITGVLAFGVTHLANIPNLAGAGVGIAAAGARAAMKATQRRSEIRRKQFYLLYRTEERLAL